MIRRLTRALVPVALVAAGIVGIASMSAPPASASACAPGAGVSVVVDFGNLAGGIDERCGDPGTGRSAVTSAGFTLAGGSGGANTVCRIDARQGAGPQPAAGVECWGRAKDHWWIFWSSQGASWASGSVGIDALKLKAGDSVALVWQYNTGVRKPGAAPGPGTPSSTPAPTSRPPAAPGGGTSTKPPKPKHTKKPAKPTAAASTGVPTATATQSPTTATSATTPMTGKPVASTPTTTTPIAAATTPTPAPDRTPSATTGPDDSDAARRDGGGLPGWLAPGLVAILAAGAGGVAWARRSR